MENEFNNKFNEISNKLIDLNNQNNYLLNEINAIKQIIINENKDSLDLKNFCPICGEISIFEPFGVNQRMNVKCPNCGSLERQRLVYLFFQRKYSYLLEHENIKLLHFAPETLFYKFFMKNKNIDYFPVDINPEIYESRNIHIKQKVDMQNIPYNDNEFDFIYNCHVLEHVPDDIKGMGELYRVLKEDGVCITLIPQFNIKETFEKDEYNTPELRRLYYGQVDHLRKYGLDFKDKLESVGFNVEEFRAEDIVKSKTEKHLYKLINDVIYICRK